MTCSTVPSTTMIRSDWDVLANTRTSDPLRQLAAASENRLDRCVPSHVFDRDVAPNPKAEILGRRASTTRCRPLKFPLALVHLQPGALSAR